VPPQQHADEVPQIRKDNDMDQIIYWKNPESINAMDGEASPPIGIGLEEDMPDGATTGKRELPTTLEVLWKDIVQPDAEGACRSERVLEIVTPPVFGSRFVYRASVRLTLKEIALLASAEGSPARLLDAYLAAIQTSRIHAPQKGTNRQSFWWLSQDDEWYSSPRIRTLQRKWYRPILEILAARHPMAAAILAEWDHRLATDPDRPYGKKKAGCIVFTETPCEFTDGAAVQLFQLQRHKGRPSSIPFPVSGNYRLHSRWKGLQPVCEKSLDDFGICPAVGFAAVLASRRAQMKAAPSAHARLEVEALNEPLIEKWSESFERWRAALFSEATQANRAPAAWQIDAAIRAILDLGGAMDPKVAQADILVPALDRRAQELCKALFALRDHLERMNSPALAA
jgi:hypothetical protein